MTNKITKVTFFAAVMAIVFLMCCPLAVRAANMTNQMVETEEELSFEGMVDDVVKAFEKKHNDAFKVNFYVFESFSELERYWKGGMKSNEILIGVVRNTSIAKVALGSGIKADITALKEKVDNLDYDSYEIWEEWAFDVLAVFLTDNSYELEQSNTNNLIDSVQSGFFKLGNTVTWFLIISAVLIIIYLALKVMKLAQEIFLASSQQKEKITKSWALRRKEEKLQKLELQLKMEKLRREIKAEKEAQVRTIEKTQDSNDEKSEEKTE